MAHPLRMRIIRLLYDEQLSNQQLAARLGEQPGTVLHHVRTLVKAGFIEAAGEQPGARGTVEKLYRGTGKSWHLSVGDDTGGNEVSHAVLDAFIAEVQEHRDDVQPSRLALKMTPERLLELQMRIAAILDEYALNDDEDGERWALFLAFHRRD